MRPENKRMQEYLKREGITCIPKYIPDGSLKHTWRLYNLNQSWSMDLADKLMALGFKGFDNLPLGPYSGNGGIFCVFVRGHYELLKGE